MTFNPLKTMLKIFEGRIDPYTQAPDGSEKPCEVRNGKVDCSEHPGGPDIAKDLEERIEGNFSTVFSKEIGEVKEGDNVVVDYGCHYDQENEEGQLLRDIRDNLKGFKNGYVTRTRILKACEHINPLRPNDCPRKDTEVEIRECAIQREPKKEDGDI